MPSRGKLVLYRKNVKSRLLARKGIWDHGKNISEMSERTIIRSRRDGGDETGLHSQDNTVYIKYLVQAALDSAD